MEESLKSIMPRHLPRTLRCPRLSGSILLILLLNSGARRRLGVLSFYIPSTIGGRVKNVRGALTRAPAGPTLIETSVSAIPRGRSPFGEMIEPSEVMIRLEDGTTPPGRHAHG